MKILTAFLFVFLLSCAPTSARDRILDIQEVTSKSGIKAWLVEDQTLPIIALKFTFEGAGSIHDGQEKQGLSRLLSNTMDEGAGELTSQEFQKALSDHSISLSFGSSRDNFGGGVTTLSRNKDKAFELLKLALTEPRFDEEPVERMRQANISRVRSSMSTPNWIAARLFNDIAYEGHPYALNSGGTLTTLQSITTEDLRDFKNKWLTQDRLVVSAAGDITAGELETLLDDIFGGLPEKGAENKVSSFEIKNQGKSFLYKKDIPQTIIMAAMPGIDRNDPDYFPAILMDHIFGSSGFGSRLMEEAREKRGLTYGVYSDLSVQDYTNSLGIDTSTKNNSAKEMMDIIKAEMTEMVSSPVSQQELTDAKSYIIGSMPLSLTNTDSIAGLLRGLQLNKWPIDHLDNFPKKIEAVTAQDIQRVSKRLLNPDKLTLVMVGEPEEIDDLIIKDSLPNVE